MDFRRYFGLRAPRPIGDSTILVPQLENYSLFATPFLDLNKKIGKLIEGVQQDIKGQSEEDATGRRKTRQASKTGQEDGQNLSKETSQASDSFGIVLNVVTVKPEQFTLAFGEGNEIIVKVNQVNIKYEYDAYEDQTVSRDCMYKYELPNGVDKNSLVALWTSDDYFIILPKQNLRGDLLNKSIRTPEGPEKSSDKEVASTVEATGSKDIDVKAESKPETRKPKEAKSKKASKCKEGDEKPKPKKVSDQDADELTTEEIFHKNCAIPVYPVTRMLRPGLDIFMLRKYMVDLESYASAARNFIENASFVSHNSKSAERCIRSLAKLYADKFYERDNLKGDKRVSKVREHSPDSGYTSGGTKMAKPDSQLIRLLESPLKA